jgi:hypothetical protein
MSSTLTTGTETQVAANVKPLPLWQSALLFGVPASLFRLFLYNGTGLLLSFGVAQVVAVILAFLVPSVLLLLAVVGVIH